MARVVLDAGMDLRVAVLAGLTVVALAGCATPDAEGEDASDASNASALAEADDDFRTVQAALRAALDERSADGEPASLSTATLRPLKGNAQAVPSAGVCDTVRALQHRGRLPNLYLFEGATGHAQIIAGVSFAVERVWDLTQRQEATFVGREYSLSGSAGVAGGVYAGLGLIDVELARSRGETVARDIVDGWSGDYFGANLNIQTPFKFAWASGGCITDKPGYFFACGLSGGVGVSTDLLPISGSVIKGKVVVSPEATRRVARSLALSRSREKEGTFEGKSYPYVQYEPLDIPGVGTRAERTRAAASMVLSMPLVLAPLAAPLALALGADADLRASRGRSLDELCK